MTNEIITVTNFVSREITGLEVVGKVNELYSSTFSHLLAVIGIIVTLGAIVIPYVSHLFQKREARLNLGQLQVDIGKAVEAAKKDLSTQISNRLDADKKEIATLVASIERKLQKNYADTMGRVFHNQACDYFSENAYAEAAESAMVAANKYCEAENHADLIQVCENLTKQYLPKINQEQMDAIHFDLVKSLENLELELAATNTTGFLTGAIRNLSLERKALIRRVKPNK